MWVVLWQELGVRPSDVDHMTLDDVLVVEIYAADAERRQRKQQREAAEDTVNQERQRLQVG